MGERKPNKPFSLSFEENLPMPYYDGSNFQNGIASISADVDISYPLIRLTCVHVTFGSGSFFPDCFVYVSLLLKGVVLHGDKYVLLSGSTCDSQFKKDIDLLLSPTDSFKASIDAALLSACKVNTALNNSLKTESSSPGDFSVTITLLGEYVDI